jgi:hypothetical protein
MHVDAVATPVQIRNENRPHLCGRLPIQVWPNRDGQGYVPDGPFEWLGRREAPMSAASPEPMCWALDRKRAFAHAE